MYDIHHDRNDTFLNRYVLPAGVFQSNVIMQHPQRHLKQPDRDYSLPCTRGKTVLTVTDSLKVISLCLCLGYDCKTWACTCDVVWDTTDI